MDEGLIQADASGGRGGDIEVRVGRLTLTNGAQISSVTFGSEPGGDLTITATDAITIVDTNLTMSHYHVNRMFYDTSLNRLTVCAHGCVAKTSPWE